MLNEEVKIEENQEHLIHSLKAEFPNLKISASLPQEIQSAVFNELKRVSLKKGVSTSWLIDSYQYESNYVNTLSAVFDDPRTLPIWDDLFKKSPESTILFIELLFGFENTYEFGIKFYKEQQQEIKELKNQIKSSEHLLKVMSERKGKANLNPELMMQLIQYQDEAHRILAETTIKLRNYSYFKNAFCPLSRKNNGDNALPIFFVRKIYYSFRSYFGSPMYSHISRLVEVIFGVSWDDNEIKKHCKRLNDFHWG